MASKKNRFEVFKRDSFTCQYCGRTPPEIILEVDHIYPKSKGGKDDITNYITACFDCNRGKGKNLISDVPESVKKSINKLKEKRLQLKQYHIFLEQLEIETNNAVDKVQDVFQTYFIHSMFTDGFREATVKRLLTFLPLSKVCEAMKLACSTHLRSQGDSIHYFCGICWNWIKRPETRNW